MPNRPVDKVYVTYKKRCKEMGVQPVEKKDFESVFAKHRRIITFQTDILRRKEPWIISDINKDMVLYTAVKDGNTVVNVWTPTECEALTGLPRRQV